VPCTMSAVCKTCGRIRERRVVARPQSNFYGRAYVHILVSSGNLKCTLIARTHTEPIAHTHMCTGTTSAMRATPCLNGKRPPPTSRIQGRHAIAARHLCAVRSRKRGQTNRSGFGRVLRMPAGSSSGSTMARPARLVHPFVQELPLLLVGVVAPHGSRCQGTQHI
jgi:hypothetical protein